MKCPTNFSLSASAECPLDSNELALLHDKLKLVGDFARSSCEVTRQFCNAFNVNVRLSCQQSGTTRIVTPDTNCKNITAFTHFDILGSITDVSSLMRFAI